MQDIAIVTGATSGVGREFVRRFDEGRCGHLDELWLVARGRDVLEEVAASCSTPCRVLALDLTERASFEALASELDAAGDVCVQWLVNSAGFGKFGNLRSVGEADNANMVRLNCLAVVETCYLALPRMRPGSRIVNMSSVAGICPMPYLSTYSATKRFVLDFSRTLNHELRGTGVGVCAVCPKFMDTGFLDAPGDADEAGRMCAIGFTPVEEVVEKAIRRAVLGRDTCLPTWDVRLVNLACKLLPADWVLAATDHLGRL